MYSGAIGRMSGVSMMGSSSPFKTLVMAVLGLMYGFLIDLYFQMSLWFIRVCMLLLVAQNPTRRTTLGVLTVQSRERPALPTAFGVLQALLPKAGK